MSKAFVREDGNEPELDDEVDSGIGGGVAEVARQDQIELGQLKDRVR